MPHSDRAPRRFVSAYALFAVLAAAAHGPSVSSDPVIPYDPPPRLTIERKGTDVVVSWNLGQLQWADNFTGTWTTVNEPSPHVESISDGKMRLFRSQW